MLTVGVDGTHEVARGEPAVAEPLAQLGEGAVVRRRHAPVGVEAEKLRVFVIQQPALDLGAGVVCGPVVDDHQEVDERCELVQDPGHGRRFVVRRHHSNAS